MTDGGANFGFLQAHDEQLCHLGQRAERYFAEDPNTCLIKLRQFGELLASHVAAKFNVPEQENFINLVPLLAREGVNSDVVQGFHELRLAGNVAVHGGSGDHKTALHKLKVARAMGVWFHRIQGHKDFQPGPFVPPPDPNHEAKDVAEQLAQLQADLIQAEGAARLAAEEKAVWRERAEATAAELERSLQLIAATREQAQAAPPAELQAVKETAAAQPLELDEASTRVMIDRQLQDAGWTVDTQSLTHKKGVRPQKGQSLAIAEWPTATGPADYVLFLGLTPVAVVEAKRKNKDVPGSLGQSKRYSKGFTVTDSPGGPWGEYKIPFLFATNGRPFLRQVKEKSGIWFLDIRRPTNRPKREMAGAHPRGSKPCSPRTSTTPMLA